MNIQQIKVGAKQLLNNFYELAFIPELVASVFNPQVRMEWARVQRKNKLAWRGLFTFVLFLEFLDAALFTKPHFEAILPFSKESHWLFSFASFLDIWAWGFAFTLAIIDQWTLQKTMENTVKKYFGTAFLFVLISFAIKALIVYTSIQGAKVVAYQTTEKPVLVENTVFSQKNKEVQTQIKELNAPVLEIENQIREVRVQIQKLEADVVAIEKSPANHKGWHTAQPLTEKADQRVSQLYTKITALNDQLSQLSQGKVEAMKTAKEMSSQILKQHEKETDRLSKQNETATNNYETKAIRKGGELSLIAIGLAIFSLLGGYYYYFVESWFLFYDTEKKVSWWDGIWDKAKKPMEEIGQNIQNKMQPLLNHKAKDDPNFDRSYGTEKISDEHIKAMVKFALHYESQNFKKPSLGLIAREFRVSKNTARKYLIENGCFDPKQED